MAVDLSSLRAERVPSPPRIIVHGGEGVGKSTFFAGAPSPIFFQAEDGIDNLEVARYPEQPATDIAQLYDLIQELGDSDHNFRTLVIDSADWLERLVWAKVAKDHGVDAISDIPYGRGWNYAVEEWTSVLKGLNWLRKNKSMVVAMTAHSLIKRFDDPTADPYDRYIVALQEKSSALLKQWADVIGFVSQRVAVQSQDVGFGKKTSRGIAVGERQLYVVEAPAYEAKNRYEITDSMPLRWDALVEQIGKHKHKETDNG